MISIRNSSARALPWLPRAALTAALFFAATLCPLRADAAPDEDIPVAEEAEEVEEAVPDAVDAAYDEMEVLTEVMLHIKQHYVEEKTYRKIMSGALHGMLSALDAHSDFLEPDAYNNMREDTSGQFSGIGIHVGIRDGLLTVIAPIEDTPAFRAGLQSGDRIVGICGEKTLGISLREAVKRMRGPKGDEVVLTIQRGSGEPEEFTIVRDNIEVPSVKGTRIVRDGIGYIRITQFASPTAESLQKALDTLMQEDLQGLILDLRSNPGGLLKSAVEVAQKFLPKKDLIVTTKGRDGVFDAVESRAGGANHYVDFPMAVLINRGSASASEIVSGALKDHNRAVLVGDRTFGKGSVQSVIRLNSNNDVAIRMTTARYYTPSGTEINEIGIPPDILVELDPDEWRRTQIRRAHVENPDLFTEDQTKEHADVIDRQLERALDLLQAIKIFRSKG